MRPSSKVMRFTNAGLLSLILVFAAGCPMNPPDDDTRTLRVQFEGLEALGNGYVYEGWFIVDGMPVSTGRFEIDEDGEPDQSMFTVDAADADAAAMFVLTIEPAVGDDPAPADTHVLAGAFMADMADLTIAHAAALGTDFTEATGMYILETPSTADIADDYHQGIWWLDPAAGPATTLDLPVLPAGWEYEGWAAGPDGPVSTGRFVMPDEVDSDDTGATSGPDAGPPFPGQDFIDPAVSLIGMAAVISVEPEPDDSAAPFAIKPLIDMDIEDVGPAVLQMMQNNAESAPTGTATIVGI